MSFFPIILFSDSGNLILCSLDQALQEYCRDWRHRILNKMNLGIRRDSKLGFDERQRLEIFERDQARCQICGEKVQGGDEAYEHHPISWDLGGRTVVDNGRLVHQMCLPRALDEDEHDVEFADFSF